ncbi:MAG TPA: imidazole glycerol phosphate synthase subunit HisH, partial [Terriglobales bacterium]|nr:imidazole glycerol phosphate synthase subunit HisH [Terriglobales bacterium]
MLAIIDYNAGNLFNVKKAFAHLGVDAEITSDPAVIKGAKGLVLPGVGAFKAAYDALTGCGLDAVVKEEVAAGKPLLGICLGMQLFFDVGYEVEECPGLGLVGGAVKLLETKEKVPHMGWNSLMFERESPLFEGVAPGSYVYFVHSFAPVVKDAADLVAWSDYGMRVTA